MKSLSEGQHWVLGVDVGDRSVGLAAVIYEGTTPVDLVAKTTIHDGGSSEHTGTSRQDKAGQARRARRRVRRKKHKVRNLQKRLEEHGYPGGRSLYQGLDVWGLRQEGLAGFIADKERRVTVVAAAVLHVVRHLGWRNTWLSYDTFVELAAQGPTESLVAMWAAAEARWPHVGSRPTDEQWSVGQLGAHAVDIYRGVVPGVPQHATPIRPRNVDEKRSIETDDDGNPRLTEFDAGQLEKVQPDGDKKKQGKNPAAGKKVYKDLQGSVLSKVRAEDQWRELRDIFAMQEVPDDIAQELLRLVFTLTAHTAYRSLVGPDMVSSQAARGRLRAPMSSLEFEEFAIVSAVANLRVVSSQQKTGIPLTAEQQRQASQFLLTPDAQRWTWFDVAKHLDLPKGHRLRTTSPSGRLEESDGLTPQDFTADPAPDCPTHRAVKNLLNKKPTKKDSPAEKAALTRLKDWDGAYPGFMRHALAAVHDLPPVDYDQGKRGDRCHDDPASHLPEVVAALAELFADEPGECVEAKLRDLDLRSERARFSRETLRLLTEKMQAEGCDFHTAYVSVFGEEPNQLRLRESLDDPVRHPTVAIVNGEVRRFLRGGITRFGQLPKRVVVEVVRSGLVTAATRNAYVKEAEKNRKNRDKARQQLRQELSGAPDGGHVSARDVRRYELLTRHNSQCLYCGATVATGTCEIDHVVASSQGGSNRTTNLVVACRPCNASKGKQTVLQWLAIVGDTDERSLKAMKQRVKTFTFPNGTSPKAKNRFIKELQARLEMQADEEPDERSLETTAYTARQMAERIGTWLAAPPKDVRRAAGLVADQCDEKLIDAATGELLPPAQVTVFNGGTTAAARKFGKVDQRLTELMCHSAYYTTATKTLDGRQLRDQATKNRFDRRHHAVDAAVLTTLTHGVAQELTKDVQIERTRRIGGDKWAKTVQDARDTAAANPLVQQWRQTMKDLGGLLAAKMESDYVPVERLKRYSAKVGALHSPNPSGFIKLALDQQIPAKDIRRLVHRQDRELVKPHLTAKGDLPEGSLPASCDGKPYLLRHKQETPCLAINGGSVELGSVHHARIFQYPTKKGPAYGWLRIFAAEFALWGWTKTTDHFTAPVPLDSEAVRCCSDAVRKALENGTAQQVGWIVAGDEIHLPWTPDSPYVAKSRQTKELLQLHPHTRWFATNFANERQLGIRLAYLAKEGWPDEQRYATTQAQLDHHARSRTEAESYGSGTPPLCWPFDVEQKGVGDILLASVANIFVPGTVVVRRTALGFPRWEAGPSNRPTCWRIPQPDEGSR